MISDTNINRVIVRHLRFNNIAEDKNIIDTINNIVKSCIALNNQDNKEREKYFKELRKTMN